MREGSAGPASERRWGGAGRSWSRRGGHSDGGPSTLALRALALVAAATEAAVAETAESGGSGGGANRAPAEDTSSSAADNGTNTRSGVTASILEYLIPAQRVIAG